MKKRWNNLKLRVYCLYLRIKYRKELFSLVFTEYIPDLGTVLTDAHGSQIMIVDTGARDGNSWVCKGYVIHVPEPIIPPTAIDLDFLPEELPIGLPVLMGGNLWIKQECGYVLDPDAEKIEA